MNSNIKKDLDILINFYNNYSLKSRFEDNEFIIIFKSIHKKIYAYLVVVMEIKYQNVIKSAFNECQLRYLEESVSDILESSFAWTNGAYKAANLLMRSSIENFIKFALGDDESVYIEKNVYKIFEKANCDDRFSHVITKAKISSILYNIYGEMCKSSHTASYNDMEHLVSLDALPTWDSQKAEVYKDNISNVLNAYFGFFLANNPKIINDMYRKNKDIFYEAIPDGIVKKIEQNRRN